MKGAQTSEIYVCSLLQMPSVSTAKRLTEAHKCERWSNRRDALVDPFQMSMPQVTREKLEREMTLRKTSIPKRLTHFFRSKIEPQPETDLT